VQKLAVARQELESHLSLVSKQQKRLATVNEEELDRQLRTAVALAEPVLLFIMAGIVGTIVVGMLLPVFTLQEYIK